MEFYIKGQDWERIYVEVEPKLSKAFDTTNDTFSCVLKANTQSEPYKPMTLFKIVDDDNEETYMWITNDSVTTFTQKPLTYKHTLTLVQYRYVLNKHLVRNTVFNQPKIKNRKLYCAITTMETLADGTSHYGCLATGTSTIPKAWYDEVVLNKHTKIKTVAFQIKMQGIKMLYTDDSTTQELIQISDYDELESLNAQLKQGSKISVYDKKLNTEVCSILLKDYELNRTYYNQHISNTIKNHLIFHDGAELTLQYSQNSNTQGTMQDMSFVSIIDNSITITTKDKWHCRFVTLQVEFNLELYNYTMYDVIRTLMNQYELYSSAILEPKRSSLFFLDPSGDLANLLKKTYPPDTLTFTQATWYDALTEIFRFYDAGFKFVSPLYSGKPKLEIEYYNKYKNEFEGEYSGKTIYHNDKNFNNGKVAYYQNANQEIEIKNINTRSSALGVPQKSEYEIVLPKPIYNIESLSIRVNGSFRVLTQNSSQIPTDMNMLLDLTPFVVNSEIWSALSKDEGYYQTLNQRNTLKFDRGSKAINVSSYYRAAFGIENTVMLGVLYSAIRRFFGINTGSGDDHNYFNIPDQLDDDWVAQRFNIKYLTMTDGRAEIQTIDNKYDGQEIVNQNDGMVDLQKLGLNIWGESLKNGEPVLTATCKISEWEDLPKEGDYIIYNDSKWIANVINITPLQNSYYQCSIEFSKNFNALSLRVRTDNEKRLTAISRNLAVVSEDNYVQYIYVGDTNVNISAQSICLNYTNVSKLLNQTFNYLDGMVLTNSIVKLVFPADWIQSGGSYSIPDVIAQPPYAIVDGNIRVGSYDVQRVNLRDARLDSYSITSNVPGYTNTITFDSHYDAGDLGIVGRFHGNIYFDVTDESTKNTTITYTRENAGEPYWIYSGYIERTDLIGEELFDISMQGFTGLESKIEFNSTSGYFYIYLKSATLPSSNVTLTIQYSYYNKEGNIVDVATIDVNEATDKKLYIPLIQYGFGNCICFETQMDDPISAGNELQVNQSGWFGANSYFSRAVPYTDDDGWADTITLNYYSITTYGQKVGFGKYPKLTPTLNLPTPSGSSVIVDLLKLSGQIQALSYYKKPNEIFGLNYQWCFLSSNSEFFIGSKFINENIITNKDKIKNKHFRLCYGNDDFKYSILDIKGHLENEIDISIGVTAELNKVFMKVYTENEITAKNWAIIDENDDIYFASNNTATFKNDSATKVITFITRRNRL